MKVKFGILVSVLLFALNMNAETGPWTLRGKVFDKNERQPLEYVAIAVHDAQSGKVVQGCVTDSLGQFEIKNLSTGDYQIVYSFIGYDDLKNQISLTHDSDLGTVWLNANATQLQEVSVTGHQTSFVQRIDKKVFTVDRDIIGTSGSVADVLQHIPSVSVDYDGRVLLRGSENVTILVNGRPSTLFGGKSKADVLQQLPAHSIERVEVITNPSAQHKPDGTAGIINIVLKKSARTGINGTARASVGNKNRWAAGLDLSHGTKLWDLTAGYNFRQDRYDRTTTEDRQTPDNTTHQQAVGIGHPRMHTFQLENNWHFTENDELSLSGNYSYRLFRRTEDIVSATKDHAGNTLSDYHRLREADAKEHIWEANAAYTHTYGKDNEWGIDYTYSTESEDEMNYYTTTSALPAPTTALSREKVWDANYLHVGKLHWQFHPTENIKVVTGYDFERQLTDEKYHLDDFDGTAYRRNDEQSSDFRHRRTIHSVYVTAETEMGKWAIMPGLRGEYVTQKSFFTQADSTISQHYANLYPTLHTIYHLTPHHDLSLNYSLRVNRPEEDDMNPYVEHINPLSLKAGNPHLMPEKIHSVEAGWMWHNDVNSTLTATLYYRYTTNMITEVARYLDNNVVLTTKENTDHEQNAGAEIIWAYTPWKWIALNLNLNGFYNEIDATSLGYGKNHSTLAWSGMLNADLIPFSNFTLQLNTKYNSGTMVPQGRRNADFIFNTGAKYDLPKIGLALTASVSDLFNTSRRSYTIDTPELKMKQERRRNPRIIWVGATYNFGLAKKKSTKIEYDEKI